MNQQQHKVVIKQLTPELLDDDALNRADWVAELNSLFVSADNASAIVGEGHCLTYDSEHHRWHHYLLPANGWHWVLARDSARLWGIVDGKLTRLDLRSGKWMEFQHCIEYNSSLHAEGNAVIAQCRDIHAIDVLRLESDSLQRIVSIPLKLDFFPLVVESALWLEENQFIILGRGYHDDRCALWRLDWNGEVNVILDVDGHEPLLRFPFVVMCDMGKKNLIYADLRENPVKPRYVNLGLCFKDRLPYSSDYWHNAFVFDDSLIVALRLDKQSALIRLGRDEEPEILYKRESKEFLRFDPKLYLLGRFLTLGKERWAYDLVAQREVHDMPWSTLLRQAIHDEAERKHAASTTTTLMPTQTQESSDVDDFKVFWHTSPYRITKVKGVLFSSVKGVLFSSVRSANFSSFHSIFLRSDIPSACLLPRGTDRLRYLLPEPAYGWYEATFDERGRVWVCDRYGKYVAVVHPDEQEGYGFALPGYSPDVVQAIAAYDNTVALATFEELVVYHYDDAGGSLKEMLRWRSGSEIRGIKPDVEGGGLWVLIHLSSSSRHVLRYLPLNGKVSVPKKVKRTSHSFEVKILGDWPDKVYFAYIDRSDRVLHYTLNPNKGWHKVSLQNIVHGSYLLWPVSMFSDGDAVFVLVRDDEASLLIRSQADNAELISAFGGYSVALLRWGEWLVLYDNKPLVFHCAYADRAAITELPENKGTLFFHLPTNRFYTEPFTSYAITDALRSMLSSGARGFLKSPL